MSLEVPNLTLLRQFVVIAEEGGISKAAKRLRISQPALSKNVRRLEEMMGTKLFERHATGSDLTRSGKLFFERAQIIGLEYQHALQDIRNVLSEQDSTISIGAGPVWASTILPRVAERFHALFPRHLLRVMTGSVDELAQDLRLGRIDIFAGALIKSTKLPGFDLRSVVLSKMGILCGQDHPLAQSKSPVSATEISEFPFVAFLPSRDFTSELASIFLELGAPAPRIVLETSSIYACMELVRTGRYLTYEPSMLIDSPIGKDLQTLSLNFETWQFDMGMVFRKGISREPHLRKLLDIMVDELKSTT